MPDIAPELISILTEENHDFKKTFEEHKSINSEIEGLNKNKYVSEEEEGKINTLKRQKLLLKDKLEAIAKEHRA